MQVLFPERVHAVAVQPEQPDDLALHQERDPGPGADGLGALDLHEAVVVPDVGDRHGPAVLADGVAHGIPKAHPDDLGGVGEAAGGDDAEAALGVGQGQRAGVEGDDARQLLQDLLDRVLEPGLAVDGLEDVLQGLRLDAPLALGLHGEGERHAAPLADELLPHGVEGLGSMHLVQAAEPLLHLPEEAFHVHVLRGL